jgi:ATP-dependent DNA helicase 2 subunit 2
MRTPPTTFPLDTNTAHQVPPKAQSRKRARADIAPLSGLDIDSLLGPAPKSPKQRKISADNPIPTFRQLLDTADSPAAIRSAVEELGAVVEKQITDSFGDSLYGRAIEEMRVMREEMVEVEEVGVWNEWLRGVKGRLVRGELGGERRDFWWEVRRERLGLVVGGGGVGEEEAKEVSLLYTVTL